MLAILWQPVATRRALFCAAWSLFQDVLIIEGVHPYRTAIIKVGLTCGFVGINNYLLLLAPGGARQGLEDVILGQDLSLDALYMLSEGKKAVKGNT